MSCFCLKKNKCAADNAFSMASQHILELCTSSTVSGELAKDSKATPGEVRKKLFGRFEQGISEHKHVDWSQPTEENLKLAQQCGKWGSAEPSELFLKIFHDVLLSVDKDPMCGMVSPPLIGTNGVAPLTIIAPLLDICAHMSNCIARAQHEVFLATNYWKHSDATRLITNALKELSVRAGKRGERVVVKIMYDRGSPSQVLDNHLIVPEETYMAGDVRLPAKHEIPNIDMEVMNYHRPVFGTFHSKFMVVDREIAIVSSNNIQENDNLEMMVRLEGAVVDSFYDMCLVSWHKALSPQLPLIGRPAADCPPPSFGQQSHQDMFDENGRLKILTGPGVKPVGFANGKHPTEHATDKPPFEGDNSANNDEKRHLNTLVANGSFQQLAPHSPDDPHYDPDVASEVLRAQSVLSPREGESRMNAVTRHLNTTKNKKITGDAPECAEGDEMATLIPLPQHESVPMALVCRKPWGAPNHSSVHVPQNTAFIGALRYAKKSVFIQTPNLNAEPLLPEIIAAVKRGVTVTYFICLGYNDAGELLPFQNGNNEMIAHKLYKELSTDEERSRLNIYNYVAKDQTRPIHNKFKKRSCHIKLLIADEHVGIQGNGNQDMQSWFHSQEINVMLDSPAICAAWIEGIRRNQNTHIYGAVTRDGPEAGCWHDPETGKQAEGAIGIDPGRFSWAKGIVGAVQRVRGEGGF